MQHSNLASFTDIINEADEIANSQPISLPSSPDIEVDKNITTERPAKHTGQQGDFRSIQEIDPKYREVFSFPYFNLVQSSVIEDGLYSDKSMVVCAPTGSGKTVVFEMAIVQLLTALDERNYTGDFKIIYMAPVKALCTERLSEWYPKFTKLGLMCIEVTGDTNVDFSQLQPYRIIITTPEKWDMLTRRWRDHRSLVEVIKLFLIDEVHILNDESRGPVLEAVVSRMKTIESSSQSAHRIEQLQKQYRDNAEHVDVTIVQSAPRIRFVAVSATISNPEDVAAWLGSKDKPAVYYKFGDECRPVALKRIVEGYPCPEGMSIFKFDIILNYKLWPIIQKYHDGKPTLIFCNTRKSVTLTAETLSKELTISFTPEQRAKLTTVACKIKTKKLQALVINGVGCHHAGLLYEERLCIEEAFRNRDLPILITTTTLAMGVNLPAHLVIIKNTQQYVNGAYQEYSISTVLQMVGRAGRPQFDREATAVIMTRIGDKPRYQALVGGSEPLQSYLHRRMAENLNSEAALGTVCDVAQCVQWLRSTFLSVRAAKEPRRYLGLAPNAPAALISKKIEELCVKAMNGLASAGLITMDEACCIESTEAGRLMSIFYLDLETMKQIMKIEGNESLEHLLWIVCESHELADMHLRVDERRTLNALNRNNAAATIRFPMKGKISTRQMKLNCIIQAVLGCLPIPDPPLNQEAMKVMRIAGRVCKCLVAYVTRPDLISSQPKYYTAVLNSLILAKCIEANLWENSPYVSKQLKGIGPTFSTLLATAGKVNFTLLEESHPRDLERIMNKGAPAGNVLRKQVSLLPKYQLTAKPIDEKRVSIQLSLLNLHQLEENRDQLTAENSHKCYIVVGDSENHLLYFTTFKDNDLISIYDGIFTHEVTRKHNFEHKVKVHCISSNWVGIDAHCDYLFKNLEPIFSRGEAFNNTKLNTTLNAPDVAYTNTPAKQATKRQTCITDTYKERKRKNTDIDITQSKEKKKRENALLEKFKCLKNSFEVTTKEIKEDLSKSAQVSYKVLHDIARTKQDVHPRKCHKADVKNTDDIFPDPNVINIDPVSSDAMPNIEINKANKFDDFNTDEKLNENDNFVIDDRISSILNEIETEINKSNRENDIFHNTHADNFKAKPFLREIQMNSTQAQNSFLHKSSSKVNKDHLLNSNPYKKTENFKSIHETKKCKYVNKNSNFSFIDSLEKTNLDKDDFDNPEKDSGFSETIKNQIEQFIRKTTTDTHKDNAALSRLLNITAPNIDKLSCNKINEHIMEIKINSVSAKENIDSNSSLELPGVPIGEINKDKCKNDNEKEFNCIPTYFDYSANLDTYCRVINPKILKGNYMDSESNNLTKTCMNNNIIKAKVSDDRDIRALEAYTDNIERNKTKGKSYESDKPMYCNSLKQNVNKHTNSEQHGMYNIAQYPVTKIIQNPAPLNLHQSIMLKHTSPYTDTINQLQNFENLIIAHPSLVHNPSSISIGLQPITELKVQRNLIRPSDDYCRSIITYKKQTDCHQHHENSTDKIQVSATSDENDATDISWLPARLKEGASKHSQETNNQHNKEYTNRYSFTATKINICTKNTTEHKVQLISKLKVDLDVTEIVSKGNQDHMNETKSSVRHEQEDDSKHLGLLQPYQPTCNHPKALQIKDNSKATDRSMNKAQAILLTPPKDHNKLYDSNNINKPSDNNVNNDINTNNNKVGNILQKYSIILRKQCHSSSNSKHFNQDTNKSETTDKAKRPFKISNIHNSEISLPKTLITNSILNIMHTNDSVPRRNKQIEHEKGSDKSEIDATSKALKFAQDVNFNIDIPEPISPEPEITQMEPLEDFGIDQLMFNPKTLLEQCFSKEESEVIIPPPSGFCNDESIYSPTHFDNNSPMPSNSLKYDNIADVTTSGFNNSSIFEDNNDIITPSNEIETWTLSQNDVCGQYDSLKWDHKNTNNPEKTYTVLRNNSPHNRDPSLKNITVDYRDRRLEKFKFINKKTLNM